MKESEIIIKVRLDENRMPQEINWHADEGNPSEEFKSSKAMFLAMFDEETEETLKLDLWTSQFRVDDMDRFVYHSIRGMADSYFKATKNNQLASAMQQFATYFGEESGVIPKPEN